MEIKVGQVWQNDKDEKFYIKEVCNKDSINSRVTFVSLQNNDEYFAGEIGSCSYECFMYQTKKLKLIAEDFSITEELDLELKIKSKINKMNKYKTEIKDIQNKIDIIKQEVDKLYDKLKEINPNNDSIFKLSEFYFIDDDLVQIGQRVMKEVEQKREQKNKETIEPGEDITIGTERFKVATNNNGSIMAIPYYNLYIADALEQGSLENITIVQATASNASNA